MTKKTSLKDIAQKVGVSTALVSYVLNNQREKRIRKEVAQKIREVAKELNYQTNQIARSLKTNKTFTLGLIVSDISNPFFSSLARIIEDEADTHNYTVIFGSSEESPQKSQKLITTLLNRQVDGLLIAPAEGTKSQISDLQQQGVPFVLIDRYLPDLKTNYVALNNHGAVYKAMQHLIDCGYKQIGLITFKTTLFHMNERKRGYQEALKNNRLSAKKSWIKEIKNETLQQEIGKAIDELLKGPQPVEALLFATNKIAFFGLKHLKSLNMKVPDDVAIVSFDETDAFDLFDPRLTCIKQPLEELGQTATRILLESVGENNKITQVNLEAELVVRDSTRSLALR